MTHASPPPGSVASTQVVFSWGAGEDGQLGLEEASTGSDEWHVAHPVPVPALAGLSFRGDTPAGGVHQAVVGGSRQSLCVTGDGALYCWGWNEKHALGLGHRNEVKQPHRVELPPGVHVQQVRVLWARRQRGVCHSSCVAPTPSRASHVFLRHAGCLGRLARHCCDGRGGGIRVVRRLCSVPCPSTAPLTVPSRQGRQREPADGHHRRGHARGPRAQKGAVVAARQAGGGWRDAHPGTG
jgi:hypothetical protein